MFISQLKQRWKKMKIKNLSPISISNSLRAIGFILPDLRPLNVRLEGFSKLLTNSSLNSLLSSSDISDISKARLWDPIASIEYLGESNHPYLVKLADEESCGKYANGVRSKNPDIFNGYCTRWIPVGELSEEMEIAVPKDKTSAKLSVSNVYSRPECKELDYKNTNFSSEINLITLPLNSSVFGCSSSSLENIFFCPSKSLGGTLNNTIPKCLEEWKVDESRKSTSLVMIILSSFNDSSKTLPFLNPKGDIFTSCPNLLRKGTSPLCTFSSSRNFIFCAHQTELSFCEHCSEVQSGCDMFFGQRGVGFDDFFVCSSCLEHFQYQIYHNSGPFESGLPMANLAVDNNVVVNLGSHNTTYTEEIFKDSDSDVLWDPIASIEYLGEEQVYDVEIEGTHNFIGNGIFAHNTYADAGNLASFINWNNSLVGWWRFNEGNGTNVVDYSGYGNNGAAANFVNINQGLNANSSSGWTSGGKFGAGMVFDGVDDYIIISGG